MKHQLLIALIVMPLVAALWCPSADASGFGRFAGPSNGGLIRSHVDRSAPPVPRTTAPVEAMPPSTRQFAGAIGQHDKRPETQPKKRAPRQRKSVGAAPKGGSLPFQQWLAEQLGALPGVIPALL